MVRDFKVRFPFSDFLLRISQKILSCMRFRFLFIARIELAVVLAEVLKVLPWDLCVKISIFCISGFLRIPAIMDRNFPVPTSS